MLVVTNGGSSFYGFNNDLVSADLPTLGTWVPTNRLPGRERIDATSNEVTHDKLEWKLGAEWVGRHSRLLPRLLATKLVRLWLPDLNSSNRAYVAVQILTYAPFLVLIIAGWVSVRQRPSYHKPPWLIIRVTLLATIVTALISWGSPRLRDANAPALIIYTVIGLQTAIRRFGWTESQRIKEVD